MGGTWEDGTPDAATTQVTLGEFKERSVVLAVAHPRASTSSYLSSQFLANSRSAFMRTPKRKKTVDKGGWEEEKREERSVVLAVAHPMGGQYRPGDAARGFRLQPARILSSHGICEEVGVLPVVGGPRR